MDTTDFQRAIAVAHDAGFRSLCQYMDVDGNQVRELEDAAGRRLDVRTSTVTGMKAVPMGEWARDISAMFPTFASRPWLTTVTQLQCVLATPGVR